MSKIAKPNSAVAPQPFPAGHLTADKRKIKDFSQMACGELLLSAKMVDT